MFRSLFLSAMLLLLLPGVARAEVGLVPDLRLLVDVSRDMKKLDPDNLRLPALEMVIRVFPEGSRVGIWTFAEEAQVLVPSGIVDREWREAALAALEEVSYRGTRTNIPAALEAATADLVDPKPGFRSSIVLLTAGKVEVAESPIVNVSASRKLLTGLAADLGQIGVPVHTVAFTSQADSLLLRSLARETGGTSRQVDDAAALGSTFLRVLEMVLPTAREPLYGRQFSIDARVEEFVVLAVFPSKRGVLKLMGPDGTVYSEKGDPGNIKWFRNRQYSTARLVEPEPGNWHLQYPSGTKARVFVHADLQLEVGPLPYFTAVDYEAELEAFLSDRGEVVTDPAVLQQYELSLEITTPRGKTQSYLVGEPAADGYYRVTTPPMELPGRYRLMLRLEGPEVQRELPVFIEARTPIGEPTLVTRGEEPPEDDIQRPLMWLAAVFGLIMLTVWIILRRRKQRKLALWQKRAREIAGSNGQSPDAGQQRQLD